MKLIMVDDRFSKKLYNEETGLYTGYCVGHYTKYFININGRYIKKYYYNYVGWTKVDYKYEYYL